MTVAPADLQQILRRALSLSRSATALVEYFHTARDPAVARTVDRTARWLQRHGHDHVTVICVDLAQDDGGHLDRLQVKVLPQPTTVAVYRQYGQKTQLWAGQATSSSALAQAVLA